MSATVLLCVSKTTFVKTAVYVVSPGSVHVAGLVTTAVVSTVSLWTWSLSRKQTLIAVAVLLSSAQV